MKNVALIQEEVKKKTAESVKMVVSRGGEAGGKQENTHTHVLAHTISNTSFCLKKAHLQGTHLACSYKIIYSVGVYALPRHVNTEAYSEPQPKVSWLKMARIYVLSQHKSGLKL